MIQGAGYQEISPAGTHSGGGEGGRGASNAEHLAFTMILSGLES